jgi:hypothetical protein
VTNEVWRDVGAATDLTFAGYAHIHAAGREKSSVGQIHPN